mmetsp:Transcript_19080/g.44157  ORF Transcript_19080/g.44157 Transcript_19080/m.44157 type:complete len:87 (+) Transcript_19080:2906-3166(+)
MHPGNNRNFISFHIISYHFVSGKASLCSEHRHRLIDSSLFFYYAIYMVSKKPPADPPLFGSLKSSSSSSSVKKDGPRFSSGRCPLP